MRPVKPVPNWCCFSNERTKALGGCCAFCYGVLFSSRRHSPVSHIAGTRRAWRSSLSARHSIDNRFWYRIGPIRTAGTHTPTTCIIYKYTALSIIVDSSCYTWVYLMWIFKDSRAFVSQGSGHDADLVRRNGDDGNRAIQCLEIACHLW